MNTIVGLIISFFILLPLMLYSFVDDELKEMEIQQLIEKGYLNADFTHSEEIDFCENIEPTLGETYRNVCLWVD